jgi:hypothetical protein
MDEANKLYRNLEDFFQAGSYEKAREAVTKLKLLLDGGIDETESTMLLGRAVSSVWLIR